MYPGYNSGNQYNWKKDPPPKKRSEPLSSSADDYQRYLEYLDAAGKSQTFQRQIREATIFKRELGEL